MIFYNKALLEQCGYSEDDIPTTWDEWKAMSDDITAQGQGEFWNRRYTPVHSCSFRISTFEGALHYESNAAFMESSPAIKEIIEDPSYYENDKVLMMEMQVIKDGTYSGLATFPKNDSSIWEIINQNVLARTTMTEDPIDVICSEAQEQIVPLQQ